LPPARRFDWSNLGRRVASAAILAPAALGATLGREVFPALPAAYESLPYLILISLAVALLAVEWGGMSAPLAPKRVAAAVMVAVLTAVLLGASDHYVYAWLSIVVGLAIAGLVARACGETRPENAALGVLYIAPACLCLVWLRSTNQGPWWTLMLFCATWAADSAAFLAGNAFKGPKLWPRFSPNKTWSGFLGGLVAAMAVGAVMSISPWFQLNLWAAIFIGLAIGLATMAGDLWESMLKRRFGVKDSGDIIPGHGGLLDRVDGLIFAVVVMAVLRFANHLGWGH
jgi:phosphatidate cytidylyltransferase